MFNYTKKEIEDFLKEKITIKFRKSKNSTR